jgi:hypothetical protein
MSYLDKGKIKALNATRCLCYLPWLSEMAAFDIGNAALDIQKLSVSLCQIQRCSFAMFALD